jgi:hypothetical protein
MNPASCPAAFKDITLYGACGSTTVDCYYPEARCSCEINLLDGCGTPTDCPPPSWFCDTPATEKGDTMAPAGFTLTPEPACAVPRPRIGSSCVAGSDAGVCNYGSCLNSEDIAMACTGGVWQVASVPCPK